MKGAHPAFRLGLAGLAIGFVGSLCGIGGGLFAVPLLHYLVRLELRRSVATGLVLVLATTTSATTVEILTGAPDVRWGIIAALTAGALVGARLGFRLSQRIPTRILKSVFVVVLVLAGFRILLAPESGGGGLETSAVLGGVPGEALALVVGLGGGLISPLLGIGGGLLMVPGLYLGIGGLGFAAARTASLAAGTAASGRSLWFYARAGEVVWSWGLPLGLGALAGAAAGVLLARDAMWIDLGRTILGVLLFFVAARFARDALRGGQPQA